MFLRRLRFFPTMEAGWYQFLIRSVDYEEKNLYLISLSLKEPIEMRLINNSDNTIHFQQQRLKAF